MNVLILAASGRLAPHVIKALEGEHTLRLTDIKIDPQSDHEFLKVDISDPDQVMSASKGMDAIINLSVQRNDQAFNVNARGCYNMMVSAVHHRIRRVINTGPHFTIAGATYETFDYLLGPDIPPQPGTHIYPLTKSLGHEICRVFTENHDIYVLTLLFYLFCDTNLMQEIGTPDHSTEDHDLTFPFAVSWKDAADVFLRALSVKLEDLPSQCELFNILTDIPHKKFSNEKTKQILGWQPSSNLEQFWHKMT